MVNLCNLWNRAWIKELARNDACLI
jgi:hypothetical protein